MERGRGASNLQIQFNLPVSTGDEFRVTKNMVETVSGKPIQSAYEDAAFYYKAYIKSGNEWVEYKVVEVEPEESAHMLEVYNVSNSDPDPEDSKSTTGKTVKQRGQVFFNNKPIDDIVNEMRITKKLHGSLYKDVNTSSGYVEAAETGTPYFEYRIFLESTNGEMVPYSLGEYYQIDGATGKYVYYDSRKQGKDKRCLAETETAADGTVEPLKEPKITEHTSQNGSLGDVRPDDTIIIKGLLEGTDFIVDERVDRSHMTTDDSGNWDNKYYYSNTDVEGAYIRGSENTPSVSVLENWKFACRYLHRKM